MPADIALMPMAQQMLLDFRDSSMGRGLIEQIGEFFPQAGSFEWLTNPDSKTFLEAFYNEESSAGWLTGDEYNEFWGYAADYADYLQNQDGSEGGFDGFAGLAAFLAGVVQQWDSRAEQSGPVIDPATIGPVEGYPGWWQGYDGSEGVWKYAQSADGAAGWMVSAQVNWDEQRATTIYGMVLAREPGLDQSAAWAAIWAAVSQTQQDDDAIIASVLASQQPPADRPIG